MRRERRRNAFAFVAICQGDLLSRSVSAPAEVFAVASGLLVHVLLECKCCDFAS